MPETPEPQPEAASKTPERPGQDQVRIDEHRARQYYEKLRMEQNLSMGIVAGAVAAAAGAALWAILTALTKFQIGLMAVGIGFIVGYSVRTLGKGIDKAFGIAGAALSLAGCVVGNFASVLMMISQEESIPLGTLLSGLSFPMFLDIMTVTFHPMDLVFYAVAVYEGYRLSFRKVSDEEVLAETAI